MEEEGSCSTSATATGRDDAIPPPDDFFDHFLQRSSSSSSSLARTQAGDGISVVESSDGGGGGYLPQVSGLQEPSSLMGASENKANEYDCESGECLDALLEEVPPKPNPPRSSSKRSRTAEFHYLSEKRRRSRINEKMKALQSLIPNSNKTDKASMLDEVIEYLKQLQLQVQKLSMRNGLTLHPMRLPRVLQSVQIPQIRTLFSDETDNLQSNVAGNSIPINQEPLAQQAIFGPPNQRLSSNEPHLTDKFGAGRTFGLESSMQIHPGAYHQLNPASEVVCREDMLTLRQSNVNPSDTCLFGGPSTNIHQPKIEHEVGARAAVSLPFMAQPSSSVNISRQYQSQG